MDVDISLATPLGFRIPSCPVWNVMTQHAMSWRRAQPSQSSGMTGTSPGNFSRDGVSQPMGLHRTGIAYGCHGAGGDAAVATSWPPSPLEAEEGISTTS
jgi:hypothetical protein